MTSSKEFDDLVDKFTGQLWRDLPLVLASQRFLVRDQLERFLVEALKIECKRQRRRRLTK